MANMAWWGALVMGKLCEAAEFLDVTPYKNVIRWTQDIQQRPAVKLRPESQSSLGSRK